MNNNVKINKNERVDSLEIKDMKIIQNKNGFCFGMDSVLLSDFAKEIKDGSICADLGTGTGILGILLCAKTNLSEIIGIEIQNEVAEMAQRSIKLNELENRFKILNKDIKEIIENKNILNRGVFDCVITNPPYKKINTGKTNEEEKKLISRHEITADLSDFLKTANYLLKDKGTLYMVHRPDRLVDIIDTMRNQKIEPKEIRLVYPQKNREPNLILIKGIKSAKPFLKVDKPLFVYEENGEYTKEILEIYGRVRNEGNDSK